MHGPSVDSATKHPGTSQGDAFMSSRADNDLSESDSYDDEWSDDDGGV